jgi:acyl-CoA dehydrogenase
VTPFVEEEDVQAILEQVERFAQRSVEPRSRRPAEPMPPEEVRALLDDARSLGIVSGGEPSGGALWEGAPDAWAASLSVRVLRRLARTNAGFALAAHRASLATTMARRLNVSMPGRGVAAVQGRFGLGRLSLARYLAGAPLEDEDLAMIADYYAPSEERLLTADAAFDWLLAPAVTTAGVVDWTIHAREDLCLRRLENAHGIDELATFAFLPAPDARPRRTTTLDSVTAPPRLGEALALEALGLLAIALGAAEHACELARAYASTRSQGGRTIDRHPAVQLLLSSGRIAIATVEALVESAVCRSANAAALPLILAARAEAHPLLCRAANDALQVLGGTGYMRDAGVEKIVRDENHLRACCGSPTELSLFVAEAERLHA